MKKSPTLEANYPLMVVDNLHKGTPITCDATKRLCLVTHSEGTEIVSQHNQVVDIQPRPVITGCDTCLNSNL